MAGASFAGMSTKWKVFGVIGIIAIVGFALQVLGLILFAGLNAAAAAALKDNTSKAKRMLSSAARAAVAASSPSLYP